jgi:hypothetical protein
MVATGTTGQQPHALLVQYDNRAVRIGVLFKIATAISFLCTSYRIPYQYYWSTSLTSFNQKLIKGQSDMQSVSFLMTRKYLCTILWVSLSLYMIRTVWFFWELLFRSNTSMIEGLLGITGREGGGGESDGNDFINHEDQDNLIAFRVYMQVILVLATAVLPGRVMRRGIAAWQRSLMMEREMNYKKTFVRYVSHEVR